MATHGADLAAHYQTVRDASTALADPLSPEDCTAQSMPDASPTKWHLAHVSWFFETFVLEPGLPGYAVVDPSYRFLFNSYYNTVGDQYARPERGLVTRPGIDEVRDYRRHVDAAMARLLSGAVPPERCAVIELGLHHEQQHQELMITDLKHLFSKNPLCPVYRERVGGPGDPVPELEWQGVAGGLHEIGHAGPDFAFDNEGPRHKVHLEDFELAQRLVTNAEYQEFVDDGGYAEPEHWLSDGWSVVQERGWQEPSYWLEDGEVQTLAGRETRDPNAPVTHLSAYEADAFARWAGARLPTEAEWEVVAATRPVKGNFVETQRFHPRALEDEGDDGVLQLFGDVWEWTSSAYSPYPGYHPPDGALGEYNGKFMANQLVLRGGSCATPNAHIRPTYRNFFYPDARWQFSGLRLARDA